jgi:molecular chaperone DnaK
MATDSDIVSLRITLRYKDTAEFAQKYAENVSSAGLFLRTKAPKPTGTKIRFELLLADGSRAMRGEGVVVTVRADDKPGMALRFNVLDPESQALVNKIVEASGQGPLAPTPLATRFGKATKTGEIPVSAVRPSTPGWRPQRPGSASWNPSASGQTSAAPLPRTPSSPFGAMLPRRPARPFAGSSDPTPAPVVPSAVVTPVNPPREGDPDPASTADSTQARAEGEAGEAGDLRKGALPRKRSSAARPWAAAGAAAFETTERIRVRTGPRYARSEDPFARRPSETGSGAMSDASEIKSRRESEGAHASPSIGAGFGESSIVTERIATESLRASFDDNVETARVDVSSFQHAREGAVDETPEPAAVPPPSAGPVPVGFAEDDEAREPNVQRIAVVGPAAEEPERAIEASARAPEAARLDTEEPAPPEMADRIAAALGGGSDDEASQDLTPDLPSERQASRLDADPPRPATPLDQAPSIDERTPPPSFASAGEATPSRAEEPLERGPISSAPEADSPPAAPEGEPADESIFSTLLDEIKTGPLRALPDPEREPAPRSTTLLDEGPPSAMQGDSSAVDVSTFDVVERVSASQDLDAQAPGDASSIESLEMPPSAQVAPPLDLQDFGIIDGTSPGVDQAAAARAALARAVVAPSPVVSPSPADEVDSRDLPSADAITGGDLLASVDVPASEALGPRADSSARDEDSESGDVPAVDVPISEDTEGTGDPLASGDIVASADVLGTGDVAASAQVSSSGDIAPIESSVWANELGIPSTQPPDLSPVPDSDPASPEAGAAVGSTEIITDDIRAERDAAPDAEAASGEAEMPVGEALAARVVASLALEPRLDPLATLEDEPLAERVAGRDAVPDTAEMPRPDAEAWNDRRSFGDPLPDGAGFEPQANDEEDPEAELAREAIERQQRIREAAEAAEREEQEQLGRDSADDAEREGREQLAREAVERQDRIREAAERAKELAEQEAWEHEQELANRAAAQSRAGVPIVPAIPIVAGRASTPTRPEGAIVGSESSTEIVAPEVFATPRPTSARLIVEHEERDEPELSTASPAHRAARASSARPIVEREASGGKSAPVAPAAVASSGAPSATPPRAPSGPKATQRSDFSEEVTEYPPGPPQPPAPAKPAQPQVARAAEHRPDSTGDLIRSTDLPSSVVGIDFGGRWIRIGIIKQGELDLVTPGGSAYIPALVAARSDGTLAAGAKARSIFVDDPARAIAPRSVLMAMKGGEIDTTVAPNASIVDGRVVVKLADRTFELKEILIALFASLKPPIVQHTGEERVRAVISIPNELSPEARALLKEAVEAAEIIVAQLCMESDAIIRAYRLDEQQIDTVLVVDVGATHAGITLARRGKEGFAVVATRWFDSLSAGDIDAKVVDLTLHELNAQANEDHRADLASRIKLAEAVERARVDIRRTATVELKVSLPAPGGASNVGIERTIKLSRSRIYQVTEDVVQKLCVKIQEMLREAGIHPRALGATVLAGSAGLYPPLVQALASLTSKDPLASIPPPHAFVLGLARQGGALERAENASRPDCLAGAIGIELPGGRFLQLVRAGEALPVKLKRSHPTTRDNQTELELNFYQGEGELVRSCTKIGHLALSGVPKAPKGAVSVDMQIEIDKDQVVTVTLSEEKTGMRAKMIQATARTPDSRRADVQQKQQALREANDLTAKPPPKKGFFSKLLGR